MVIMLWSDDRDELIDDIEISLSKTDIREVLAAIAAMLEENAGYIKQKGE